MVKQRILSKNLVLFGLIKTQPLIQRPSEHFWFKLINDCSSLPVIHFHRCKSAYLLAIGPSILYAILQFLYYHQKISATVINTAPVLPLSCRFSFDSACSPLPAVYKTSSNKETYCSRSYQVRGSANWSGRLPQHPTNDVRVRFPIR